MSARSPQDIAEAIREAGLKKADMPERKMLVLSILAGVYVGFGAQFYTSVKVGLSAVVGSGLANLIGGTVFSLGLILVVLCGAELFTGDNMMAVACISGDLSLRKLVRCWGIIFVGNLTGSIILGLIMFASYYAYSDAGAMGEYALNIANMKVSLHFVEAFFRGVGCNWLVCLAIWMVFAARDVVGKVVACFFPVTAFVAMGLEHSVANMYFVVVGLLLKDLRGLPACDALSLPGFIFNNLLPVTLGNIVGGALFVGVLYWYIYLYDEETAEDKLQTHKPVILQR